MKKTKSCCKNYFIMIIVALFCMQLILSFDEKTINISPTYAAVSISGLNGEGTSNSPYLIESVSNLQTLANHVNNGGSTSNTYFKLQKSLNLSGYTIQIGKRNSSGITYYFEGIFDGNNCVIFNLNLSNNSTNTGCLGLFGYLDNGTIKNLRINSGSISLSANGFYAGAFVGLTDRNSNIENCINLGCTVTATSSISSSAYTGGIVGFSSGSTTIFGSLNYASVKNQAQTTARAGGIVGYATSSTNIKQCYNSASISAGTYSTSSSYAAGISAYGGKISNCFNTGGISANAKIIETTYYFGFDGSYKYNNNYYTYNYKTNSFNLNNNASDNSLKNEHIVYGDNNLFHVRILEAYDLHTRTKTSKNAHAYGIAYNPSSIRYCYSVGSYSGGYSGNTVTNFYCKLYDGLVITSSNFKINIGFYNNDRQGPISNKSGSYCYYSGSSYYNAFTTFSLSGAASSSGAYYYNDNTSVNKKIGIKLGGTTQYVVYTGTNNYYLYMYDENQKDPKKENFIQVASTVFNYTTQFKYETTPSKYIGTKYSSLKSLYSAVVTNFSSYSGVKWSMDSNVLNGYPHFNSVFWQNNASTSYN